MSVKPHITRPPIAKAPHFALEALSPLTLLGAVPGLGWLVKRFCEVKCPNNVAIQIWEHRGIGVLPCDSWCPLGYPHPRSMEEYCDEA